MASNYRPDIDGLRALAVMPVLLYHAKLGCPGGFVGVDIFFVISGYLITSIIASEIQSGSFQLWTFWERRVRRILPALSVVVASVFLMGFVAYLPDDFASLGSSIICQATLVSNFFFYAQPTGYFDVGQDTQPVLHTWSLAVEEQFYIFFPILFSLLPQGPGKRRSQILAGLLSLSLLWNVVGTPLYPKACFYLLPARAWELLLGALLAETRGTFVKNGWIREACGLLGLALTAWPICFYNDSTSFPGAAAIAPCCGAALIICSSEGRLSLAGHLLAFKPLVFIGLISYSLYLWHWPVLVFSQYLLGNQRWPFRACMVLLAFALAILSWWLVETPFRKKKVLADRRWLFSVGGATTFATFLLGLCAYSTHGWPSRYGSAALAYADGKHDHSFRRGSTLAEAQAGEFVPLGSTDNEQPVELLIWGDSHAMGMTQVLDDLCRMHNVRGVQATQHGTPPVLPDGDIASHRPPSTLSECVIQYIVANKIKIVFVNAHWKFYAKGNHFLESMQKTIDRLKTTGAEIYVVKDVPDQGLDVPRVSALAETWGGSPESISIPMEKHLEMNRNVEPWFNQLSSSGVKVLDPAPFFLDAHSRLSAVKNGKALYTDGNHLSITGARLLMPLFAPAFVTNP